jgi:hypothetical protein
LDAVTMALYKFAPLVVMWACCKKVM